MNFKIQVIGFDKETFQSANDVLNTYSIIFEEYELFILHENNKDFIDFLKWNITSENRMVANVFKPMKFELHDFIGFYCDYYKTTITCEDCECFKTKLYGSFVLNNQYVLHFIGYDIFIENIKTKEQYYYYCD